MMKRLTVSALALTMAVMTAAPVLAGDGWVLLGTRTVTDRVDHDVVAVGADRGRFSSLRLEVRRHAVELRDVTVVFGNGDHQKLELRRVIPAGGSSRVLDLAGDDRVIQRIELRYDAQSVGRKAVVRVVGRR
jgi:hypothetical protein